jgi:hypothetical protein
LLLAKIKKLRLLLPIGKNQSITIIYNFSNYTYNKVRKGVDKPLFLLYNRYIDSITNTEGYIMKILFEAATLGICWFAIIIALNAFMG